MKDEQDREPDLGGTVSLTLDAGVARDLLQALILALGPGRGADRRTEAVEEGSGGDPSRR